jgi:hypothetical protein
MRTLAIAFAIAKAARDWHNYGGGLAGVSG